MSTPPQDDSAFRSFVEAFRRERQNAFPALVDWQYVRHAASVEDQKQLARWEGKQSLLEWIRVMGANRPVESGGLKLQQSLIDESHACYKRLFESLGCQFDVASLDRTNALDFSICNLVPNVRSVLDYGAGYGRQAFLFSRLPDARVFANDAVETSYFSQYWVFRTLGYSLWEYFGHESSLQEFLAGEGSKVIHLPTWRNDLIPDRSLDLVLFVWCLSEMSRHAPLHAIETCMRTLRPGGYIYLRDDPHSHGWEMEKQIIRRGFLPVFQPWVLAGDEKMNGVPRLYRYIPDYLDKRNSAYCRLLLTAWRTKVLSLRQLLVAFRRLLPF